MHQQISAVAKQTSPNDGSDKIDTGLCLVVYSTADQLAICCETAGAVLYGGLSHCGYRDSFIRDAIRVIRANF